MTGADSPVIADSSTDAMPSTTSPSLGINSPAFDHAFIADVQRGAHTLLDGAVRQSTVGQRLAPSRAERLGLSFAPTLGDRLGEVGEEHREPEEHGDETTEDVFLGAESAEIAHEEHRRKDTPDFDHEHHRVARLYSRVELLQRVGQRPADDLGSNSGRVLVGGAPMTCAPDQRLRCSTMGPSARTGKYVRPTTTTTTPVSRPAKSGVFVGNVPEDVGTACLRTSEPATANAEIMSTYRPINIAIAPVVLNQSVLPDRPANAEPLLLAWDVNV